MLIAASGPPRSSASSTRPTFDDGPRVAAHLPRWLPAEPLIAALDSHRTTRALRSITEVTGIDRRTFERLRHRRRIRSDSADRIAVALGRHPSEIWPEWFPGGAA